MSEIDEISARLVALETVVRQLVTHLAVRSDDPPGWVATRKILALRAADGVSTANVSPHAYEDAVRHFFRPMEAVAADYRDRRWGGTGAPNRR